MTALEIYMNHFETKTFIESSYLSRRATRNFGGLESNPQDGHNRIFSDLETEEILQEFS